MWQKQLSNLKLPFYGGFVKGDFCRLLWTYTQARDIINR